MSHNRTNSAVDEHHFNMETDSEDGIPDLRHSLRIYEDAEYSSGVDQDISRMELLLDGWLLDLKRNVLVSKE